MHTDDLRNERANSRPLADRITSAEANHNLAQQVPLQSANALTESADRKQLAEGTLTDAGAILEDLRQQQVSQPQDIEGDQDNLLDLFDELVDAVEATPAAMTARIYAAMNAVRTIPLIGSSNQDAVSIHSVEGDDMD